MINKLKKRATNVFSDISYSNLYFDDNHALKSPSLFKNEPPIRDSKNKKLLISAMNQNMVDIISSASVYMEK